MLATCLTRSSCPAPRSAPAPGRRAARRRPPLAAPPAGKSTGVDLGGEPHEVLESLANSDEFLKHVAGHDSHKRKRLGDLMQTQLITASPDDSLEAAAARLVGIEGCPVVDAAGKLVGVLSKKDLKKGGATVKDVMAGSPIALHVDDKPTAAAHAMIDNKIHRVPVVDDEGRCLGLVTRSDLFWHLASQNDRVLWLESHGVDLHA